MSAARALHRTVAGGRHVRAATAALAVAACVITGAFAAGDAAKSAPAPAKAACVEDTAFMRRNHMDLLLQHRDRTVKDGVRTTKHSLVGCVNCHADKDTGSVVGRNAVGREGFCAGCHSTVAVRPDCFECHSPQRSTAVGASAGSVR